MGNGKYDKSKDVLLVKRKVKDGKDNFWTLTLVSYDGGEPKLDIKRWYVGSKDNKWHFADPEHRLPLVVVREVWSMRVEIERNASADTKRTPKPPPAAAADPNGPEGY